MGKRKPPLPPQEPNQEELDFYYRAPLRWSPRDRARLARRMHYPPGHWKRDDEPDAEDYKRAELPVPPELLSDEESD